MTLDTRTIYGEEAPTETDPQQVLIKTTDYEKMPEYWEGALCRPDVAAELLTAAHMVSFNPEQANRRVSHSFVPQKSWNSASLRLGYKPSGCD